MNNCPCVSIIVLNFNGKEWFRECFDSLRKLNYPKECVEIIMGDNASTDDSVEYACQNYPEVKCVCFEKNYGFCKSNNLCAQQAKGEYLVFLSNDTFVTPDWLRCLVGGVLSEPGVASCASKIFFPHLEGGKLLNAAGGVISPAGGGFYDHYMEKDSEACSVQKYTGFGCGAGVLVEKKFFNGTGGFDEYYFYSGEEMDLGMRAWMRGFKVLYIPSAVMYHYGGKTGFRGKGVTPAIEFLIVRNGLYFILKNFQPWAMLQGIVLFLMRVGMKLGYALFTRNFRIVSAILKACFSPLKDMGKILSARRRAQSERVVGDAPLMKLGIILSARQMIRRNGVLLKNMRKYSCGSIYDKSDSVEIEVSDQGEYSFRRP